MSEIQNENQEKKQENNGREMLNAFKQEFSTSANNVYVNSLKDTVPFREISVKEQKSLSKIMIENDERKDIIYDAQCALINKLCLKDGFDIYDLTEFDRIKILMEVYQNNYFSSDVTYKCKECGCENKYTIDFEKIIGRLNEFSTESLVHTIEDPKYVYTFHLAYPNVRRVADFHKTYARKYRNITGKERTVLDHLGNVEYMSLYINRIEVLNKATKMNTVGDMTELTYTEAEQLISMMPQSIFFSEDNGVLKFTSSTFIDSIGKVFQYEKCAQCGAETEEGIGSVADFF
jgi:hypothetical protein